MTSVNCLSTGVAVVKLELAKMRRYRRGGRTLRRLLLGGNPALVIGLNLPFLVVASVSLRAAAAVTLELLLVHMGTLAVMLTVRRAQGGAVRLATQVAVSTLLTVWARLLVIRLFGSAAGTLGMFLYLMAVNGMTLTGGAAIGARHKPGRVLVGGLLQVGGFALAIALLALAREYAGYNTLWGVPLPATFRLSGVTAPFFGLILAGFLLGAGRFAGKAVAGARMRERARREARFLVVRDERHG